MPGTANLPVTPMHGPPDDPDDPREWCVAASRLLADDHPEAALAAADEATRHDDRLEWGHRLASLALERLGRHTEAVSRAELAVRLAPGSWAARLRLGSALRRVPGRWREARAQAAMAVRFAPEEPDAHVLVGDLALARGEHERAAHAYRSALADAPDHSVARINLGLTLLRWEPARPHHDPAWAIDPRETGRARRAIETWSWQVRAVLASALPLVAMVAADHRTQALIGGLAALALVAVATLRQARGMRIWSYLPQILARDLWLAVTAAITPLAVAGYAVAVLTLPARPLAAPALWTGLCGFVVANGPAVAVLRVLIEAWRGRPIPALAEFATAMPERTARRNADIALWIVLVRVWSIAVLGAVGALLLGQTAPALTGPATAAAGLAVPAGLAWARRRAGLGAHLRRILAVDRSLALALALVIAGSVALAAAGTVTASVAVASAVTGSAATAGPEATVWLWRAAVGSLLLAVVVFIRRAVRAWWRGMPGPWRPSLTLCDGCGRRLPGDAHRPAELSEEVRRAFTSSRGVVLAYTDPAGPRALAVGAVASVGPAGELRLIAAGDAWQAAERDPRVAVFAADPIDRRFWAEVRGIALPDAEAEILRVTPKDVLIGEFPGRHRSRRR